MRENLWAGGSVKTKSPGKTKATKSTPGGDEPQLVEAVTIPAGLVEALSFGSCPPDEENCDECGYMIIELIGGVEFPYDNQCKPGCIPPLTLQFTKAQMANMKMTERCLYVRCCRRQHSGMA